MADFLAAGAVLQVPDAAALGAAVERLLGDPEECARMGARGREFARQHFSVEAAATETLRVYRLVAS